MLTVLSLALMISSVRSQTCTVYNHDEENLYVKDNHGNNKTDANFIIDDGDSVTVG